MLDNEYRNESFLPSISGDEPVCAPTRSRPTRRVRIVSTAFYAPEQIETSEALAPRVGRSTDWIVSRTGVRARRIAQEPLEELAARAARGALSTGAPPDLILNASATTRQLIPDTSVFIQQALGFEGIPSFSVHATCLSFLVALNTAASLIATSVYRRALVVSAELGSRARNLHEPHSAALLGDGAAAAVLEPSDEDQGSELLAFRMSTWPKGADLIELAGGGTRRHPDDPLTRPEHHVAHMDGTRVFRMAFPLVKDLLRRLLDESGLGVDDIDLVVPHQASGPALDALPRLGFDAQRIVNIVADYGNCIAASLPMALAHADAAGRLRRGNHVLLLGTGAGLSVAGAVLRW